MKASVFRRWLVTDLYRVRENWFFSVIVVNERLMGDCK